MILAGSVFSSFGQTTQKKNVSELEWLIGSWTRTNTKPGRSALENWRKKSDTELTGRGVILRGVDTVFVEKIKIVVKEGELYYVADVPENKSEVYFRITEIGKEQFVCENPQHDFPKNIQYRREGDVLRAVISGDGKEVEYLFKK